MYFSKFLNKGKIYAFEPDPYNFSYLVRNIKSNNLEDKVIPINKGLGSENSHVEFATNRGGSKVVVDVNKEKRFISVEVIKLDDFVFQNNLPRVNYIKMDVEGFEMEVLNGGLETIKKFRPKLAVCVYHLENDPVEIANFMKSLNYKIYMRNYEYISEYLLFGI